MKKYVAGVAGALLISAGLVASTGTAAHADPYPGTIATSTKVSAPKTVTQGKRARVCATVTVKSGTGTPVGTVKIKVKRNTGGFKQSASFSYAGGEVCMKTSKLTKLGGYTVRAQYSSKAGTVYNDSAGTRGFDVVKKK